MRMGDNVYNGKRNLKKVMAWHQNNLQAYPFTGVNIDRVVGALVLHPVLRPETVLAPPPLLQERVLHARQIVHAVQYGERVLGDAGHERDRCGQDGKPVDLVQFARRRVGRVDLDVVHAVDRVAGVIHPVGLERGADGAHVGLGAGHLAPHLGFDEVRLDRIGA